MLSQTGRCWPFGATKTEKQTWNPPHNPFITAPALNPNTPELCDKKRSCSLLWYKNIYILGWSSSQLSLCGSDPHGQWGERWKLKAMALMPRCATGFKSVHVTRVAPNPRFFWCHNTLVPFSRFACWSFMPSNTSGQIIQISPQRQSTYGCTFRGLNICPQWQKRLKAIEICLSEKHTGHTGLLNSFWWGMRASVREVTCSVSYARSRPWPLPTTNPVFWRKWFGK